MYQVLDYKLACYLPFLARMRPGVFQAASDIIEIFDLGSAPSSSWTFDNEGFTAAAHPNTVQVGTNHGVFVLDEDETLDYRGNTVTQMCQALEVLQKPSKSLMRAKGVVQKSNNTGEEFVYTDSFYFYDHGITKKFISFYKSHGPFDCELDSYGDYFQPLGSRATEDYVYNTAKVVTVTESLIPTRKKLFQLLHGSPLHVIRLNVSKFHHLGTTKENLQHLWLQP